MADVKVTIVIPIFNIERFLRSCIESCVKQKFSEVILVDDGSTDKSTEICMEYVDLPNVKYIRKENSGLSAARNTGLVHASGEYVLFVDSDDMLMPNTVTTLLNIVDRNNYDLLFFSYKSIDENFDYDDVLLNEVAETNQKIVNLSAKDCLKNIFSRRLQNYSWSFLAKRELYLKDNVHFPEKRTYEDIATTYRIVGNAVNIAYAPNFSPYLYRNRKGSIANTANIKTYSDIKATITEVDEYLAHRYSELRNQEYLNFVISFLLLGYMDIANSNSTKKTKYKLLKNAKKDIVEKVSFKQTSKLEFKYKIAYVLFRFGMLIPIQNMRSKLK
ncbi:glycosyltransferase family 2 protein [Latilactobacillus curvatus]|uniref:glycosyltransferase family 2 protein n=1 Tax=Latilactobacillus curvatus TaxID=28038 RepID=UPI0038861A2A